MRIHLCSIFGPSIGRENPKFWDFYLFSLTTGSVRMVFRREETCIHYHRGHPPFFSFSGSISSMLYTLLSGPMVYTLFPCFPKENDIHNSVVLLCDLGVG